MLRHIAWGELRRSPLQTALLVVIIALTVAASVFVASLTHGLVRGLTVATDPFPQVIGAKGSAYQLTLNTVFLQDRPLGNLSAQTFADVKANPNVRMAVPLAYGDNYAGYRIAGTDESIFAYAPRPKDAPWLRVAQGRAFAAPFEAVIGARVARDGALAIGDTFHSVHGMHAAGHVHADQTYTVVGILAPVDGPYDQVILTDIRSIWIAHDHHHDHDGHSHAAGDVDAHDHDGHSHAAGDVDAHDHDGHNHAAGDVDAHDHDGHDHAAGDVDAHDHDGHNHATGDVDTHDHDGHNHTAGDVDTHDHAHDADNHVGEVTAIMIQPVGYGEAMRLAQQFQSSPDAQLVFPAQLIIRLFALLGQGEDVWRALAGVLLLLTLLIVLFTLYLAGLRRLRERAVLRILGATSGELVRICLWQNLFVIGVGALVGYLIGTAGYALLATLTAHKTAVTLPLTLLPEPLLIVLATIVIGCLAGLIPAFLLQHKDSVTRL